MNALQRALRTSTEIGSYAVTVDAIDEAASAFYSNYGFAPLIGHTNRLYLPMASIARLGL
jgi:hypothetical protein